jgi:nitrogen fixation protein FixH
MRSGRERKASQTYNKTQGEKREQAASGRQTQTRARGAPQRNSSGIRCRVSRGNQRQNSTQSRGWTKKIQRGESKPSQTSTEK